MTWIANLYATVYPHLAWIPFLKPPAVPGWAQRITEFKLGRTIWEGPLGGKLVPFPFEWAPAVTDLEAPSGLRFLTDAQCSVSGEPVTPNTGVRCARCGALLHEQHAHMLHGLDVPRCARCKSAVERVIRAAG